MSFHSYIAACNKQYATGIAREHAYRPAFQNLLEAVIRDITVTNDPARISCGAPDFILSRHEIAVGYIEAKDIGHNLDVIEKEEQVKRYSVSLDNLILTDYLEFRFYLRGDKVDTCRIAEVRDGKIVAFEDHFERLHTLLSDFAAFQGQTIKSSRELAKMMADKARLMKYVFSETLKNASKEENAKEKKSDRELYHQWQAFRKILVHDMDEDQFADVYAQTIAYGLFTARLHDRTLEDFSRGEALTLIPKSNPFLRQLFQYVAGADLDDRVVWIVDALCEVFRATDLRAILEDFGTATGRNDPILHFYETFLAAYDPNLRKSRGVWYTPEPVVNFIVRAIDDVLKSHFGIAEGIADQSKTTIEVPTDNFKSGKRVKDTKDVHKVQLLDVATGTGTFLAEVVKQIYPRFQGMEGIWNNYIEDHLLPRLHGFELLMASYAMCHMKLDLLLNEMHYVPSDPNNPPRLSVYLTNALEKHHEDVDTILVPWLSDEANEASRIKRDMPIMVAFGNPPYSGESANKGKYIMDLIGNYKKEPGGKIKLKERNSKWLNDDYVKFIRLGEHYIERNIKKTGGGILAYITNHAYLDNPTFRGMRWHLLNTFDDIYILDLHGNAKKKEATPDGKPDKNVFDIQQGVSIIIAIKKHPTKGAKKLSSVYHADLWGERQDKYDFMDQNTLETINWQKLVLQKPQYFFVPKDYELMGEYQKGIALDQLFPVHSVGIVSGRDKFTIHEKREDLIDTITRFSELPVEDARTEFNLGKDAIDWKVQSAQKDLHTAGLDKEYIQKIYYRPFDIRWTYYTGKSGGFHCRPREKIMHHMTNNENIALNASKQQKSSDFQHVFIHRGIAESSLVSNRTSEISYSFPLYTYTENFADKHANFNPAIYDKIKTIIPDITPESLFDYIYAVLHSPAYRARYAEYLKSDFPRIPYPPDSGTFYALAEKGEALRALHLMESKKLEALDSTYPVSGTHMVKKPRFEKDKQNDTGKVWINETQYFGAIPQVAWEFYIGGYQPAQKWLKDRKNRNLTLDEIQHYRKIIKALHETSHIMNEINQIPFLPASKN